MLIIIYAYEDIYMKNIDIIQKSIDYIEENLKSEISAEFLAEMAGFSLFHYYRIFQKIVGIPVMQYMTRRKLLHAAYAISNGSKVIDTALLYGFKTNAGFYKAFMNEFNCSPLEYVNRHVVKHPYRINLKQEEHIILTKKRIAEVLVNWNMQNEEIKDYYYSGTDNRADSQWNIGDKYTIKVGTNLPRLKRHLEISRKLSDAGFEIALPFKTKEGEDYYFDGDIYFYIESKIIGLPINGEGVYKDPSLARHIGEVIGQLDLLLAEYDDEFIHSEPDMLLDVRNNAIPKVKLIANKIQDNFYDEYLDGFSQIYDRLPKQLIHKNLCPNNFIMRNEKIIGITDYELSEKKIRIFEPCYAATAILSENFRNMCLDQKIWIAILNNIVHGYDSVVKLSETEKAAIPYVIYSIQMICISYFAEMDKFEELAKTNIDMLEWLIHHLEINPVF